MSYPSSNMFSTVPEGPYASIKEKVPSGPPAPAYSTSRTLHIYSDSSWSSRNITIADADRSSPLYTLTKNSGGLFSSKPHLTVTSAQTSAVVGTATFHSMSSKVDLDLHGRHVLFEREGLLTRTHGYASPAFGYDRLKWKCEGWGSDLILVNSQNQWIARFDAASWAMKKVGRLEIGNGSIAGAALDEIVVSGLAMVELERRRKSSSE
ncbi:MAG: hypothetical protein LQ350_007251 [Teloschistes chrysophthalmus]|nr:MAG: hypothetical protein LQ350_007251 [Niorma chrysophthalma]